MKEIPLTKGFVALVDDADFDYLNQFKWCADDKGYAKRTAYLGGGRKNPHRYKTVFMHRVILGVDDGIYIDHINLKKYDNRRSNLRIATYQQNSFNRTKVAGCASQYKGVRWRKDRNRWTAVIVIPGKGQRMVGSFDKEWHAAFIYDAYASAIQGEFAHLNFAEGMNLDLQ